MGRVQCLMNLDRPTAEVENALEQVLRDFPQDADALDTYARFLMQQKNYEKALQKWLDCLALPLQSGIAPFMLAMLCARECADGRAATRIVELAPEELSTNISYRCRVLLPYCEIQNDTEAGMTLLSGMQLEELDEPDAFAASVTKRLMAC